MFTLRGEAKDAGEHEAGTGQDSGRGAVLWSDGGRLLASTKRRLVLLAFGGPGLGVSAVEIEKPPGWPRGRFDAHGPLCAWTDGRGRRRGGRSRGNAPADDRVRRAAHAPRGAGGSVQGLDVRAFALRSVLFTSAGGCPGDPGSCAGREIDARELTDSLRSIVVLDEDPVDDLEAVIAHELAHGYLGHLDASAQAERAAAALCGSWGLGLETARGDPEAAARAFYAEGGEPVRVCIDGDALRFACGDCGRGCLMLAPVVPGARASVGVGCDGCDWFTVAAPTDPCGACGARVSATWAPVATPEAPIAEARCACGRAAPWRIEPDLTEWRGLLALAVQVLAQPGGPDVPGRWLAGRRLRAAAGMLDGDARGEKVGALGDEAAAVGADPARLAAVAAGLREALRGDAT
jgi:hypothetical protein